MCCRQWLQGLLELQSEGKWERSILKKEPDWSLLCSLCTFQLVLLLTFSIPHGTLRQICIHIFPLFVYNTQDPEVKQWFAILGNGARCPCPQCERAHLNMNESGPEPPWSLELMHRLPVLSGLSTVFFFPFAEQQLPYGLSFSQSTAKLQTLLTVNWMEKDVSYRFPPVATPQEHLQ